jgi:putative SOS response-associated peptidase YedK
MCGRYYRRSDKQCIADAFEIGKLPPGFELPPDYNIAPSTFQPVIRTDPETGERELTMMRWGLVPAKIAAPDSFKTFSTTNARAQSRYWTSRSDADHSVILVAWFRWTDSTNGYSAQSASAATYRTGRTRTIWQHRSGSEEDFQT